MSALAAGETCAGTHGQTAPVGAAVHPLHVHHRPEQADVVVDAAKCLHTLEQLYKHTGGHRTAVVYSTVPIHVLACGRGLTSIE